MKTKRVYKAEEGKIVNDMQILKSAPPGKKGPRILGAIIIFLIILFLTIEFFIREEQEFSPTSVTPILLSSLQIIVLLLSLIIFSVLGRNLIKLYLERKRKVVGAHFKTKLVFFFIALSLIPTLLLFFFASDLISRNIEQWFKTPLHKIMSDTKSLADEFYLNSEETTLRYARQLGRAIKKQFLASSDNQRSLNEFIQEKLREYDLDEIGIYENDEELFSYLSLNLPLKDYQELPPALMKSVHQDETFTSNGLMGNGVMVRSGFVLDLPDRGKYLIVAGKFIPQNYAQKMINIHSYVERYDNIKAQKNPVKTLYLITLSFITLLIIFAASWIGFHLAKTITVPIEKLAHATKQVSRGNWDVKVEDPASGEIGTLIDSFNQMIFDLNESHQKIAQKTSELEARRQYIETILNNITTGVMVINSEGIITTLNPSALEMLGLHEKNHIGKSYKDIFRNPRYGEISEVIQLAFLNQHKISDKEINIHFGDQSLILSLTLSPLRESDDPFSGLIVVLENLTQLIKAQKIAAWKEVAQRVAHEIKNPLTPIQLSAERIIKKLRKNEKNYDEAIEDGAKTIVEETRTIKALVDEFSKFVRLPEIHMQSTNMHEIIDQTVSLFKGIFPGVEFEMSFSPEVPLLIRTDPEQMKRVFINIMDNAIHAMNKKGRIQIQTSFNKQLQKIKIEIADTGPGIFSKDKNKLFLPHFSTKKKGAGLGLAIVNQIIDEHNGSISIEKNQPQGAKFIIQIPS